MNRINRKLEYALIALHHLQNKKPGELSSVKEISELYHCPYDLTARVMQIMAGGGLLKSEHGAHGGYQLMKDLHRVSLYDLMTMVLGPMELARCLSKPNGSHAHGHACDLAATCNIQSPIAHLHLLLSRFYQSLGLAELLSSNRSKIEAHPQERRPNGANHGEANLNEANLNEAKLGKARLNSTARKEVTSHG